jgi:hypothetical protein
MRSDRSSRDSDHLRRRQRRWLSLRGVLNVVTVRVRLAERVRSHRSKPLVAAVDLPQQGADEIPTGDAWLTTFVLSNAVCRPHPRVRPSEAPEEPARTRLPKRRLGDGAGAGPSRAFPRSGPPRQDPSVRRKLSGSFFGAPPAPGDDLSVRIPVIAAADQHVPLHGSAIAAPSPASSNRSLKRFRKIANPSSLVQWPGATRSTFSWS